MNLKVFLISFSFLFSGQPIGGVLAVVGDQIITQGDFLQQLDMVAKQEGISPQLTPKKYEALGDRVLSNIIDQYVLLDFAIKDSTIIVSDLEVKQQVEQQVARFVDAVGSVGALEKMFNMSLQQIKESYWEEVYHSMLIDRFKYSLLSGFSVGKKEVENFFFAFKDSLPPLPETGNFSLLNLSFKPSQKTTSSVFNVCVNIKDSIVAGLGVFDDFVLKYSEDSSSLSSFGVVGFAERGSLFPEYEEAVFSSSVGDVVGPIQTSAGFHVIKVLEKRGEKINSQHILKTIKPTQNDKQKTIEKINSIYNKSFRDVYFLESYIDGLDGSKNNFTGNYYEFPFHEFPDEISSTIERMGESTLSEPFVLSNGSILLVYLYDKTMGGAPSLLGSFEYVAEFAKQKKASDFLGAWLINSRKKVYINIFDN